MRFVEDRQHIRHTAFRGTASHWDKITSRSEKVKIDLCVASGLLSGSWKQSRQSASTGLHRGADLSVDNRARQIHNLPRGEAMHHKNQRGVEGSARSQDFLLRHDGDTHNRDGHSGQKIVLHRPGNMPRWRVDTRQIPAEVRIPGGDASPLVQVHIFLASNAAKIGASIQTGFGVNGWWRPTSQAIS